MDNKKYRALIDKADELHMNLDLLSPINIESEIAKIKGNTSITNTAIIPPYNKLIPSWIEYTITDTDKITKAIRLWIERDKTVLIKWPKWTGKTSWVAYVCQELQKPLLYMQLTGHTSVDEFIWCYLIKDWSTYWSDWILATAMKNGYVLVLDEPNMATWEITAVLHSVMDDRKILVQGNKEWDNVIKAHKDFRIVATINPSDEWSYVWTKEMNEALVDRFKIVVDAVYPDLETEVKILSNRTSIVFTDKDKTYWENKKEIPSKFWVLTRICKIAQEVRRMKDIDYTLSTRNLIDWAEICCFISILEAYEMTFKNKIDKESEKSITALVRKNFSEKEYLILN